MLVVIALGGNALLHRSERPEAQAQEDNVREAVAAIRTILHHHDVVLTHGNGPQIGLLALESEDDPALSRPYPMDALSAATGGMIGYWLQRELAGTSHPSVTVITQTVVSRDDPEFSSPTKYVGQVYDEKAARTLAAEHLWEIRPEGDNHWRRVMPSPLPTAIVELDIIRRLVQDGVVVICCGGGGVPVTRDAAGLTTGVEAVIDKDRTAALLATDLEADALLLLTDARGVQENFGTAHARTLGHLTPDEIGSLDLPAGSMGPKVAAACDFVQRTGGFAAIGRLDEAASLLAKTSGTIIEAAPARAAAR